MDPLILAGVAVAVLCTTILLWIVHRQKRRHQRHVLALEARADDDLTRLGAEHDDRVRRLRREWEATEARAHLALARDLLGALDALDAAISAAALSDDDMTEGLRLIQHQSLSALSSHGIERVLPEPGEPFDPEFHEAVDVMACDDEHPSGTLITCHRAGYRHPQTVLRAALVTVARAEGTTADEAAKVEPSASADEG